MVRTCGGASPPAWPVCRIWDRGPFCEHSKRVYQSLWLRGQPAAFGVFSVQRLTSRAAEARGRAEAETQEGGRNEQRTRSGGYTEGRLRPDIGWQARTVGCQWSPLW